MSRVLRGIVAGLLSALVALGVAELVAATSPTFRSPVIDVGNRVIDLVPPAVKNLAISWFGTNDKVALLVGIGALLALYAALVGVLAVRGRLAPGVGGIALFGVVGALAALTGRDDRGVAAVLPSLLGTAAAVAALVVLVRAAGTGAISDGTVAEDRQEGAPSRRAFLAAGAGLAGAGLAAGVAGRWLGGRFSAVASRASVVLPRARRPLPVAPASIVLGEQGVTPFFTPNADFYRIDTALQIPQVRIDDWRLRIGGMVERPMELSFGQLMDRDVVEADITMTCVSNQVGGGLLGTARWLGVRLDDLLDSVGVSKQADQIVGRSVDGYTCGFPSAPSTGATR